MKNKKKSDKELLKKLKKKPIFSLVSVKDK